MTSRTVTVTDNTTGKRIEMPVREGTHGPPVVEIKDLYKEFGYFTYDAGFTSTASCRSDITFIDGENGILLYRGYPIEQLAEHSSFLEVSYLLLHGELPTREELDAFNQAVTEHTMINESLKEFFDGFHYDAHPMAMLTGVVASLSAFYHDAINLGDPGNRMLTCHRVLAKMPTIAAAAYKHMMGEPFVYPLNRLYHTENLLNMLFSRPTEPYEINPIHARALDQLLILHADHEQNASAATVRLTSSTGTNPFASIASGCAALWGPAHGGANEAVLNMLHEIGDVSQVPRYLEKAKDKDDPFRLMGFGHRVYKNFDPRAKVMKQSADEVLELLGVENNPTLQVAKELEKQALADPYFTDKKLFPNVDFYSGIILEAMGFPTAMFTPIFAVSRTIGWISQWKEMITDPQLKIGRPRQLYQGVTLRDYTDIETR